MASKQQREDWTLGLSDSRPVCFVGREQGRQRNSRWDRDKNRRWKMSLGSVSEPGQRQ